MDETVTRVLIGEAELQARVSALGAQIAEDYAKDENLLLVSVLKGSVIFLADLMRAIQRPLSIDFLAAASYGASTQTSGVVRILKDLETDIAGRSVLLVEDIIDSGMTLRYVREILLSRNPASLKICTLLSKPDRREVEIPVDYIGFDIPNEFVVGYGLDYAERYRNLPYIAIMQPKEG
jgi:hypoxanthine phosphoribosyltransferase